MTSMGDVPCSFAKIKAAILRVGTSDLLDGHFFLMYFSVLPWPSLRVSTPS